MKKLFALFLLSLTLIASPSWAQKVTDLPPATLPLAGPELLSILQPGNTSGTTSQVTAAAVASAAGEFYVKAYGAKCDGMILYTGVRTTSGSNIISSDVYNFTSADIGKHVSILGPAAINQSGVSSTPFPNTFVGTITGISGISAVLSGTVGFTEPNGGANYQGAALRMYLTDDTTAIQNTLNAANASSNLSNNLFGTTVRFPRGVCAAGALTFYSGENIIGAGKGNSVVMLKNGANTDLFRGFVVAVNSSPSPSTPQYSVTNFSFQDIQLDGNRSANTGSNEGTYGDGTGDGIRAWAANAYFHNIAVNFFAADGIYTAWDNGAGSPCTWNGSLCINGNPDGMESWWDTIDTFYNAGYGVVYGGPTDSNMNAIIAAYNGIGGLLIGLPGGTGGVIHNISNSHTYANGLYGYYVNIPYSTFTDDEAEGNVSGGAGWDCQATCALVNSYTANIGSSVGMITGSGAVLNLTNSFLSNVTLGNSSSSAVNSIINSGVGTINAGAGSTLTPAVSVVQNNGTNPIWSYPTTSTNGPFQIINSNSYIDIYANNSHQVAIGTSTPQASLDDDSGEFLVRGGTAPTIGGGACGTSPTISGADSSFTLLMGSGTLTSCVVNFGSTWATAPKVCDLQPTNAAAGAPGTTGAYVSAISTTQLTITGANLTSASYGVHCY